MQTGVVRSEAEWSSGFADTYVSPETMMDVDFKTARGLPGSPQYSRLLVATANRLCDLDVVKDAEQKLVGDIHMKALELDRLANEETEEPGTPFSNEISFVSQG